MPFSVACPCGKTYSKPEHKAGTYFRCHQCGRELAVSDGSVVPDIEPTSPSKQQAGKPRQEEADSPPPPRPSILRTIFAWVLIVLGLTGIVGGVGQIFIYSMIQNLRTENAKAQARMAGEFPPLRRLSPNDAGIVYAIAAFAIVLGLVFIYTGFRLRKSERVTSQPKPRRKKKPPLPTENG